MAQKADRYYFEQLNKEQQKAYYAMKEGLQQLKESIMVPKLSSRELGDIYFMIRMDHPEIFYTVKFTYRYYQDSTMVELLPEYLFKKDKIKEHIKAMESRVSKLAGQAKNLSLDEKLLFIHDFMLENVKYDKLKKEYSHEIIGALGNGVAVCEGIAKGVKILCDALGIWCILALSEANPDKGIKYRHAWNVVQVDGKFYHIDATFDNTLSKHGFMRHDYMKLSDQQIFRDHEPVIWKVPVCEDGSQFYYKVKKVSWTTVEEVENRAKQAVKKNKDLLFHWRGGYLTKAVLEQLLEVIATAAKAKEKVPYIGVNWPQGVLQVRFVLQSEVEPDTKKETVEIEEANEGEIEEANEGEIEKAKEGEIEEVNEGEIEENGGGESER